MSKSGHPLRSVLLVTVSVLGILVLAFALYFLLFMLIERVVGRGEYNFVSMLRGGFGIVFLLAGVLVERTHFPLWFKAAFLATAVAVFSITMSILLYETPILSMGAIIVAGISALIYLVLRKKEWVYYYGIILSIAATLFYIR